MIRVAVIGTGFIGKVHIEQIRRLGCAEVIALADAAWAEATAGLLNIPKAYTDYRALIETEKPDVVHICTPNHTHYEIAMFAMERGCHVVCEKPMALNTEQAERMAALAASKGLVNGINLHNRCFPMVQELHEMVAHGKLGRVHSLNGWYLQDWLLYDTDFNWRVLSEYSGCTRAVADIGSHWMDTAEFVVGSRITEVFADFLCLYPKRKHSTNAGNTFSMGTDTTSEYELVEVDTEDHGNILLRFDNGSVASFTVSQITAGRKACLHLNVAGTEASAQWCSDSCNQLWVGSRSSGNMLLEKDPGLMYPEAAGYAGLPGGHGEGFADAMKNNFADIYAAVQKGDGKHRHADFGDGAHLLQVCQAIYESAHSGKWVAVAERGKG